MDRITETLLAGFCKENDLEARHEAEQFEHFSAFSVIRRHYSRSFSTDDVVLGGGGDTGIDAAAIIVNNTMITDLDALREIVEQNDYVEPVFIFVQSERSAAFDGGKITSFGFGITDFFSKEPQMPRSEIVAHLASITDVILTEYAAIHRSPRCHIYYVTTGRWVDDAHLISRRNAVVEDVQQLSIFNSVEMTCIDATALHDMYRKTKSAIQRQFLFDRRVEMPATEGVIQSVLGYLPFSEFRKLLTDESGKEMLTGIFEDNVRDWQGYKAVNSGIRDTLLSERKSKFVLMNNGVTIITRGLSHVGSLFTITDYQVVNGCQTSNVLFGERDAIDDSVQIPLRLVHTKDDSIKELITKATNSQTDIKPDQFASSKEFARGLEQFFATYPEERRLYYERRDGQYDRGPAPKLRVINTPTILRSYAAIFKEVPHAVTRSYRSIRDEIGDSIFAKGDKYDGYYYAAYSWFTLETLYRNKTIDASFKSARYHMLLAVHLMINAAPPPHSNSKAMEQRATQALECLWDPTWAEYHFKEAANLIESITDGDLDRDHVRTEAVTDAIIHHFRKHNGLIKAEVG